MSITINGSGTLTGVSVGGLPDGIVDADTLATDAVTTVKIEDDAVTDAKQDLSGAAKAWVNFNGTGTVAIRAAFNVSSITDNGTGDYTVNFTTAMPDANYSAVVGGANVNSGFAWGIGNTTPTSSSYRIIAFGYNGASLADPSIVSASFFR